LSLGLVDLYRVIELENSIGRRFALALRFRSFHPPREIVSKSRERAFKRLAALSNGLAFGRQGLPRQLRETRTRYTHCDFFAF
jgi:hypothetical protein